MTGNQRRSIASRVPSSRFGETLGRQELKAGGDTGG